MATVGPSAEMQKLSEPFWVLRRRFLPLLWRNSLWAYRQYRSEQRPIWLRRVFGELVVREDVWSGETRLPGLSLLDRFESAAAAADIRAAEETARGMIDGLHDPLQRGAARIVLAARALFAHDLLSLTDRLLLERRDTEDETDAELERVLLTLGHGGAAEKNRQIIERLVQVPNVPLSQLMKAWVRSRWLYEGPSHDLLEDVLLFADKVRKKREVLLREVLALAFLLNDAASVKTLLASDPEISGSYHLVLPLASYLIANDAGPTSAPERARISKFAELYAQLNAGTTALVSLLRDKTRSIAIVGNSACELGSGKGPLVDSHDFVARFNLFSVDERFACDYGRKCNIHVRHPEIAYSNQTSLATDWIVINRPDLIYRQRNWDNVLDMFLAGANLAALPVGFHQPLYQALRGEPSGGITFCALVKAARGELSRDSCFGFSFVDQVGKHATSAHYFRNARPSFKHPWARERVMFEELTAPLQEPSRPTHHRFR